VGVVGFGVIFLGSDAAFKHFLISYVAMKHLKRPDTRRKRGSIYSQEARWGRDTDFTTGALIKKA
jgi:hypothetical protein